MIGLRKEWNRKQYLLQKSFFAYSLFTAAQFLRRWFSALTQTVTQTRKKSGGIIRTGKDAAVEIFEWKGAEMPRNVHQKYPTNLRDQEASGSNPDTPTMQSVLIGSEYDISKPPLDFSTQNRHRMAVSYVELLDISA